MSYPNTLSVNEPFALAANEGRHFHFLNHLATVKVPAGEGGALSAVEFVGPKGFGPPLHCHDTEDEMFIVLDGEMVFRSGDVETVAGEGGYVFLPHGRPHIFQVLSETARFATITASQVVAPEFDRMVTALGTPTDTPELPVPGPIDPAHVAEVCRAHGIEILGPPPAPLD